MVTIKKDGIDFLDKDVTNIFEGKLIVMSQNINYIYALDSPEIEISAENFNDYSIRVIKMAVNNFYKEGLHYALDDVRGIASQLSSINEAIRGNNSQFKLTTMILHPKHFSKEIRSLNRFCKRMYDEYIILETIRIYGLIYKLYKSQYMESVSNIH